ncbi:MAG: hypothetical protein M3O36_21680, partial [Myxococcota bacterium]|nr:hypothetical protein [Myxococcota bacterium]
MPSPGVYAFEGIDESLPYVPLAARRVLDALGRKLPLEGWLSLPLADRQEVLRAGLGDRVAAEASSLLDRASP